jgi:hypothetical protein
VQSGKYARISGTKRGDLKSNSYSINKLVVANRIHIIEPQWNPSVESQAIGRILRHGQERSVTVIRYIIKRSVEEVSYDSLGITKEISHGYRPFSHDSYVNCSSREVDLDSLKMSSHPNESTRSW